MIRLEAVIALETKAIGHIKALENSINVHFS